MQELRTIPDCRSYFEKRKHYFSEEEKNVFIKKCEGLRDNCFDPNFYDSFQDLIDEIEVVPTKRGQPKKISKATSTKKVSETQLQGSTLISIEISDLLSEGVLRLVHKELLRLAIEKCKGNRTETAKYLGVSIRTLRNWINKGV